MGLDILHERGVPLDRQIFTWRDLVRTPISKLDDDAFTRVRVLLLNAVEAEAQRFSHACARMNGPLRLPLARVRRVEHHQQLLVNALLPPDQSALETAVAHEQAIVEVTASVALQEPDARLAQVYRFVMLEDFDHLYRFAALMDRVEGRDANNILQSYTDVRPGRPASASHRAPEDELREAYDRATVAPVSRLNLLTVLAGECHAHAFYTSAGAAHADPVARQLYAEIASLEEQHVTQYESLLDPREGWLEQWLWREAAEVYAYWSCAEHERNPRVREVWTRFCEYELGQLHAVMALFEQFERRDPAEVLPATLPAPLAFESHREFIRETLRREVDLRPVAARGGLVHKREEPAHGAPSAVYRAQLNAEGSPSETVAAGYHWGPGTELANGGARRIAAPRRSVTP